MIIFGSYNNGKEPFLQLATVAAKVFTPSFDEHIVSNDCIIPIAKNLKKFKQEYNFFNLKLRFLNSVIEFEFLS